jgi:hypothetical protein
MTPELHRLVFFPVSLVTWLLELHPLVFLPASLPVMALKRHGLVNPSEKEILEIGGIVISIRTPMRKCPEYV